VISLSNVAKSFGERVLFEGVSLRLDSSSRYGLVGANGCGKTTLMSLLIGDDSPSDGSITIPSRVRVGVLKQDHYRLENERIIDVAMMGDETVYQALEQQRKLLLESSPDASRLAELEEQIHMADGYTLESRAAEILEGLGIASGQHQQPLSVLSGGYKLRVLLAQTLVGRPDLLLLDEPTNHLDILTIRWLENFLPRLNACAVIISHDHRFLDKVATHILDVDYQTVTLYSGSYEHFLREKAETRARKEAEIERQQKIIDDKKAFVERFRAKATKARQAQSRLKQIEKIEVEDLAQSSRRAPAFQFDQTRNSGKRVLQAENLGKSFDEKRVLEAVNLEIRRGDRLAIIGGNGLGKSTMLKCFMSQYDFEGLVEWGYETHIGYFPQDHGELFSNPEQIALDYLWDSCPQESTSFVRGQLGRMLFSGEEVEKKVKALSGGERARLIFSRISVAKPNVLVLDEPTNHLDLESIEALVKALKAFEGTILFVSHDRWFVSELATRIVEVREDGIRDYAGTYNDYLAQQGDDHLDADAVVLKQKRQQKDTQTAKAQEGDWQAQKDRRARLKKLQRQSQDLSGQIETKEARIAAITETFCEPGFFESTDKDKVQELQGEQARLEAEVLEDMETWEQVETELASFDS
jgi:ATPase subunit of ABC transporter with duplicated ATPase domains